MTNEIPIAEITFDVEGCTITAESFGLCVYPETTSTGVKILIRTPLADLIHAAIDAAATNEHARSIADFVAKQEPLGAEFERVLDDNAETLYHD